MRVIARVLFSSIQSSRRATTDYADKALLTRGKTIILSFAITNIDITDIFPRSDIERIAVTAITAGGRRDLPEMRKAREKIIFSCCIIFVRVGRMNGARLIKDRIWH